MPGVVGQAAPATTAARHPGVSSKELQDEVVHGFGHQAKRLEYERLVRSAVRIQSRWRGMAARRLWISLKRTVENISWVLVCTTADASGKPSEQTEDLLVRLQAKPLHIMHFPSRSRRRYYIVVSATDDHLVVGAEDMRLRMFLKPKKIFKKTEGPEFGTEVDVGGPEWFGGTCEYTDSVRHEFIPASQLALYIAGTPPSEDEVPIPQEMGGPSFFNSGERQRITRHIIENMGEDRIDLQDAVERHKEHKSHRGGKEEINFDLKADDITCLREFFPLHHDAEMNYLYQNWASLGLVAKHIKNAVFEMAQLQPKVAWAELCKLVHQPLHLIRCYYGERIALYYAFVGAYTRALMLPMALGIVCQVEYWFGAGYFDFGGIEGNWTGIVYSLYMSLWSVYFLVKWSRLEGELRFVWGTEHAVTTEHTRYAFTRNEENPYKYNPLTETNERAYGPSLSRAAKFVPTIIFVLVCVGGVALAGMCAIYIKAQGPVWNALGSNLNFLSIVIFQSLYNVVSERLNDWENWQTQDEWDNSFIKKLFLFQFVNNFFFLFFLAYFKYSSVLGIEGHCKYNELKQRDSCMEEVGLNMLIVFALKTWGQQIVEVSLPFVKAWARHNVVACGKTCSRWHRMCSRDVAKRMALLDGTPDSAPGTRISYSGLSRLEKEDLMDELTVHRFKPGEHIVQQGEAVSNEQPALFIISMGLVTVVIDGIERPINLGMGHNFGERSLLLQEPRTATIKAVEHCTVLGMSRATYKQLGLSRLKWKSNDYDDLNSNIDRSMLRCKLAIEFAMRQALSTKVEKEYKLESYSDLDAFKDFNEMVIQFGYITLFAVALPIAPVLAVLNNFVEIRGDAFALCKGSRRRPYQTKRSIGSWYTVLEILSMAAVITNALLTGFINSTVADLDPQVSINSNSTQLERWGYSRLWMWVFIFEHIMLVARTVMKQVIGSEAEWVHLQRNLLNKRVKTDIETDSRGNTRKRRVSQISTAVDAFVTQLKKKTDSEEHKFSMSHCTIQVSGIPRQLAREHTIERLFGTQGPVLAATIRLRDGKANCWALVTFSDSPTAFKAVQEGPSGVFKQSMIGVDKAVLLKLSISHIHMDRVVESTGAFNEIWKKQVAKVNKAYARYGQGYSSKTLRRTINSIKAGKIMMPEETRASKTAQVVQATSQDGHSAEAESEEIRPQMSTAMSPAESVFLVKEDAPVSPHLQPERGTPETPAREQPTEVVSPAVRRSRPNDGAVQLQAHSVVINVDNSDDESLVVDDSNKQVVALFHQFDANGDGTLGKSEIGSLLIHLRAKATESAIDDDWLAPTQEEIDRAMRFMDLDGNGSVSLEEFLEWWDVKGGWEYASDPGEWG